MTATFTVSHAPDDPADRTVDDRVLLRRYVERRSEAAFAEIVRRYVDQVYSAARRQMRGDPHAAEDVTQAVFLLLSKKAPSIGSKVPLGAWLHRATRYAANNARRADVRRRIHEQEAAERAVQQGNQAMMRQKSHDTSIDFNELAPVLDGAVDRLGEKDRQAIVLRFFQGMSHQQVASSLGVSEDAAKQRVLRAVEKLRKILSRRHGVAVPAVALGSLLVSGQALEAAPAQVAAASISIGGGAGGGAAAQVIAQSVLRMLWMSRVKLLAGVTVGILAIGTAAGITAHYVSARSSKTPTEAAPAAALSTPGQAPVRARGPDPAEGSPKAALLKLYKATYAGDREAFEAAVYAENDEQRQASALVEDNMLAAARFARAVQKRWPKDPVAYGIESGPGPHPDVIRFSPRTEQRIRSASEYIEENRARVTMQGEGPTWMIQDDGVWKIWAAATVRHVGDAPPNARELMTRQTRALETTAGEVEAGKYGTARDAINALLARRRASSPPPTTRR